MSLPLKRALTLDDDPCESNGESTLPESTEPKKHSSSDSRESLTRFFGTIAPSAKRFAMSITRRWNEAEELVQESFFRLTRAEAKKSDSKNDSSPQLSARKAYLFTTIRNLAIDQSRKNKTRRVEPTDLNTLTSNATSQRSKLALMEAAVEQTLEQMNPQWSDALRLKINGELTYAEIAQVLEATRDQVRGWIFRGRKQIANELNRLGLMESQE